MKKQFTAILYAVLAALFYAINTPVSKLLLTEVPATFLASFLYLGAGIGIGILYLFRFKNEKPEERLTKQDLPCTIGMIVLDIAAPILMMLGIQYGTASGASLLGNFEIVSTALIALLLFREAVSGRLWIAIILITAASILLSFQDTDGFRFSPGSLLVLAAAACWGLENNCTRRISEKSTYEIVVLKGLFSGTGAFVIAVVTGEKLPGLRAAGIAMLLGFVAYGLSIFTYIRAQRTLGAAKTSAYYALAPFLGMLLAFVILGEKLSLLFGIALLIMLIGTVFVIRDTLSKN